MGCHRARVSGRGHPRFPLLVQANRSEPIAVLSKCCSRWMNPLSTVVSLCQKTEANAGLCSAKGFVLFGTLETLAALEWSHTKKPLSHSIFFLWPPEITHMHARIPHPLSSVSLNWCYTVTQPQLTCSFLWVSQSLPPHSISTCLGLPPLLA